MKKRRLGVAGAAALAFAASSAFALDLSPDGVALQVGGAGHGTVSAGGGLVWDWNWKADRYAQLTAQTELLVTQWRAHAFGGGDFSLQQIIALPVLRMQLQDGRSPWFLELGVGASYFTKDYATPDKTFSTRWNFYDVLGSGYKFGGHREHELGLRLVHISNAGLRSPNPGENFLQMRYGYRF